MGECPGNDGAVDKNVVVTITTSAPARAAAPTSEQLGRRIVARVIDVVPLVLLFVFSFFPSLDELERNHACQAFSNAQVSQNPDCNIVRMERRTNEQGEPTPVFTLANGRMIDADHPTLEFRGTTYIVDPAPAASYLLPLAYALVVFVVIQGQWGWTPGKAACGIRLANAAGNQVGTIKAFARWAVVDGLIGVVGIVVGLSGGPWLVVALSLLIGLPLIRMVTSLVAPNLAGVTDNALGVSVITGRAFRRSVEAGAPQPSAGPQGSLAWPEASTERQPEGDTTAAFAPIGAEAERREATPSPWLTAGTLGDAGRAANPVDGGAEWDTAAASAALPIPLGAGEGDPSPAAASFDEVSTPSGDSPWVVAPSEEAPITRPTDLSGQRLASGVPALPSPDRFEADLALEEQSAPPSATIPGPGTEPDVDAEPATEAAVVDLTEPASPEPSSADAEGDEEPTAASDAEPDSAADETQAAHEGEPTPAAEEEDASSDTESAPAADEPLAVAEPQAGSDAEADLHAPLATEQAPLAGEAVTAAGTTPSTAESTDAEVAHAEAPATMATATALADSPYQPTWDAARRAYICWDPSRREWVQWDVDAETWGPISQ